MKQDLYTIQEVATLLGVSPKTLRRWEESGLIKPIRTMGNQRRYREEDIKKLERRRRLRSLKQEAKKDVIEQTSQSPQLYQSPLQEAQAVQAQLSIPSVVKQQSQQQSNGYQNTTHHYQSAQQVKPFGAATLHPSLPQQRVITQQSIQTKKPKNTHIFYPLLGGISVVIILICGITLWSVALHPGIHLPGGNKEVKGTSTSQAVLAATSSTPVYQLQVNIPGLFGKPVTFLKSVDIKKELAVAGISQLRGGVITNNANINAGTGKITASNILYSIQAGANISITGNRQNPTISATGGVSSLQGSTGAISLSGGSGISLNGLQITNSGVLSLQGDTGDVTLSAGNGISISGTTITNSDTGSSQNIFKHIVAGTTTLSAASNDDTVTFASGSGIVITGDASSKTITITSNASGTLAGLITDGVLYGTSATNATSTGVGAIHTVLHGTGGVPSFSAVSLTQDVSGILPRANGGTGQNAAPTNGEILIGDGSGYQLATIATSGSGIGVANGSGTITLSNNGVLSLTGTADEILVAGTTGTPETGAITLTLPQDIADTSSPTFSALTLSKTSNQLILGSAGNTSTITTATTPDGQTYTLPDGSGTFCLVELNNCTGSGGGGSGISGGGTLDYIAKFASSSGIEDSSIYDNGKVGIGTTSPQGLFSVSGALTGLGLVNFNETGNQDIFSASASGTPEFAINHNGDVQFTGGSGILQTLTSTSTGSATYNFPIISSGTSADVCLNTGNCAGLGGIIGGTGTLNYIPKFTPDGSNIGNSLLYDNGTSVGVNTNTPTGLLDVNGAVTGQALTVLNYTGSDQNILVGSASGTTRFEFDNAGDLNIIGGTYQIGGSNVFENSTTLGDNVITSSLTQVGTITSGTWHGTPVGLQYGGTGQDFHSVLKGSLPIFTNDGVMGTLAAASDGEILTLSSGVPAWESANGTLNFWNRVTNALSPINITDDLLLGSDSTASAKFGFLNDAGGVPTASIAASITPNNAVYITGDGTVATTNKQTLTLGSITTGNIHIYNFTGGAVQTDASGNLFTGTLSVANGGTGIGTTPTTGQLLIGNGLGGYDLNTLTAGTGISIDSTGSPGNITISLTGGSGLSKWSEVDAEGILYPNISNLDVLFGGTSTASAKFAFINDNGSASPVASVSATTASGGNGDGIVIGGDGSIQSLRNNTLTVGGTTTGDIAFRPGGQAVGNSLYLASGGNVGVGTTTPRQQLSIGSYLDIYSGSENSPTVPSIRASSLDNLILNSYSTGSIYFNYDTGVGTGGEIFGNGNGAQVGSIDQHGYLTMNGTGTFGTNALINGAGSSYFNGGNLGIGTAVPGNGELVINQPNNTGNIFSASSSGTTDFVITNSGNVGIGTTGPGGTLSVVTSNATGTGSSAGINLTANSLTNGDGMNISSNSIVSGNLLHLSSTSTQGDGSGGLFINISGANANSTVENYGQYTKITNTGTNSQNVAGYFSATGATYNYGLLVDKGLVGFGTTIPSAKLEVDGAYGSNGALIVNQLNSGDIIDASASGATKFVITNAGNVGIGTTAPPGMLSVASANTGNVTGGVSTWGNSFSLFGPNAGNATGTALALGYDTTDDTAVIDSGTPGSSWNSLELLSSTFSVLTNDNQGLYQDGSGKVGIGTSTPNALVDLRLSGTNTGDMMYFGNTTDGIYGKIGIRSGDGALTIEGGGNDTLSFGTNGILDRLYMDLSGNVGIGTTGPNAPLEVDGAYGSNAAAIINQNNSGDLFTASRSGTPVFTITNAGAIALSGNVGSNGDCITSNGASEVSWGTCGGMGTYNNYWQLNAGAIVPFVNSADLLLGGTATASADFAIYGIDSNSPTASLSAYTNSGNKNGLSLNSSTATIQSLNRNTLTLGGSTTGNIAFQAGGTNPDLYLASNGNVGIGTTNPTAGSLDIEGNPTTNLNLDNNNVSNTWIQYQYNGSTQWQQYLDSSGDMKFFDVANAEKVLTLENGGFAGIDTDNGGNASLVVNQPNSTGDIFSASQSGNTKFTIQKDGTIVDANYAGATKRLLYTDTFGTYQALAAATNAVLVTDSSSNPSLLSENNAGYCLASNTSAAPSWQSCSTLGLWRQASGTIYPGNSTEDLLIGGTASSSAKFAVLNVNGSASPVASVSATTASGGNGNGIAIGGDGSIQSLRRNTLTLGGSTTGDIAFKPGGASSLYLNSAGDVGIGTTNPGYSLDVNGDINLAGSNAIYFGGNEALDMSQSGNTQTQLLNLNVGGSILAEADNFQFQPRGAGTGVFSEDNNGDAVFNTYNSETNSAFQLQNKSGSAYFDGDSQNLRIGIGAIPNLSLKNLLATLDVRGTSGTLPVASVSGATTFANTVIDQSGTGDIFTASKSGATKFTIKNSGTVIIGNNTNGIQFDPTATATCSNGSFGIFCGTARPTKQIVLSPEFAGAALTASDSATVGHDGFMTSDASPSAQDSQAFRTYYQWTSTQTSLNNYTVVVRVTLPEDFSGWATSGNAMSIDMNTSLITSDENALNVYIYNHNYSDATPVLYDQNERSASPKTWKTIGYTSSQLSNWDTEGQTATIYLKMYAKDENYVQVGDIVLNYLSSY
jgi:excisionase family DNA binding protein